MSFEEFQNLARLYVVGAIDEEDIEPFKTARTEYGERAEDFIVECRKLNAMFALSLRPHQPKASTREKLLDKIRAAMQQNGHSSR